MTHSNDPALDVLFLPFDTGALQWPPTSALFLRARLGAAVQARARDSLHCEQTFKPYVDDLRAAGFRCEEEGEDGAQDRYPLVLLLPPRQREEARALMARALERLSPGGRLVACAANTEGARSHESDLRQLAGDVQTLSKSKHRVFWTTPLAGGVDAELAAQWRALDAVQPIENGRFLSRPGVFAWDRIDPASALLAAHLPADLRGRAADLGAGFGYLSIELLSRCPGVAALDVYEAELRALDLARRNLDAHRERATLGFHWSDVTQGLPHKYDVVVTNPPFHTQGGAERLDVGRRFIAAAAEALAPGGRLWLVANRHLPYEAVLAERFGRVNLVAQQGGFKVIEAVRAQRSARR